MGELLPMPSFEDNVFGAPSAAEGKQNQFAACPPPPTETTQPQGIPPADVLPLAAGNIIVATEASV